ncbi:hypothetical protein BJ944DRAFT_242284 [Cunninghamella echinulata]|nr:hypothetical protein BJ944DRAFT_242284 [Cunninghamella echinulata]
MSNTSSWINTNKVDPFQDTNANIIEQEQDASTWLENSFQDIPKWSIQTDKEQIDQQKAIHAMESRLNIIKQQQQQINYPRMKEMNDCNRELVSEEDEEDEESYEIEDENEGLYLLWQERYTDQGLDDALQHKKIENQYIHHPWLIWLCGCCFT